MNILNRRIDLLGIDKSTFYLSLISVLFIATFILYDAEFAKKSIDLLYKSIVNIFGPSYLILTIFCFFFLIFLSISKLGNYKFGGNESSPEFSYISWIGMLFCSGIGGGIIYWSGVEWTYYVGIPQFGIVPIPR